MRGTVTTDIRAAVLAAASGSSGADRPLRAARASSGLSAESDRSISTRHPRVAHLVASSSVERPHSLGNGWMLAVVRHGSSNRS